MGEGEAIPLVGRDAELGLLLGYMERGAAGRSQAALIEGEAGIGKSRLLDEVIDQAAQWEYRVCRGAGHELERNRPFGVVGRALGVERGASDPALAALAELVAPAPEEIGPLEPGVDHLRLRVLDEILALLERWSSARPVLIALEDLNWSDPSTLQTVQMLGRRLTHHPVAMVLTFRPNPMSRDLTAAVAGLVTRGALELVLGPLDDEAVLSLVGHAVGAPPATRLRAQAAKGGGNPLWVLELVHALVQEGMIEISGGQAEAMEAELPASLRLTILRRLGFLSDETLQLLRVASLLGATFALDDLSLCLDRPALELLGAIDEAVQAGILGESGDRLRFRHDLLWEAIYRDLPLAVRRALHLQVGRTLARVGRPPADVAMHLMGASAGDAEAVEWLRRAAREASARAPGVAADLLGQARRLADGADPRGDELAAELVAVLVRAGRPAEAESLARETLAWAPASPVAGNLRWGLAAALGVQGRLAEALEETLLAAREPGLPDWRRARLLAEASQLSFYTGEHESAVRLAEEAITAGERHGDDVAVCLGLTAASRVAVDQLELARGIALSRQSLRRARDSGVERTTMDWIHPAFDLGGALLIADELAEAEATLRRGRHLREELGSTWDLPLFTNALAHAHLYAGRWDDAVAEAQTVLSMVQEGASKGGVAWTYSLLAYVALHRDELGTAEEVLCTAQQSTSGPGPPMAGDMILWCRALLREALGEATGVASLVEEAWELEVAFKVVTRARMGPDAVRLARAAGADHVAVRVTADVEGVAERTGSPLYRGLALRCRGLLEADIDTLLAAVAALRRCRRPVELAFAAEDAGVALGRAGRVPEAVSLLGEAVAQYEQIDAGRDVARTDAALRALGVRRGRPGARPRDKVGWDSVTRAEEDVVALVGQGLTNAQIGARLFVSPRTVETHLSHLYRKLGISSRTALAAEAARRAG